MTILTGAGSLECSDGYRLIDHEAGFTDDNGYNGVTAMGILPGGKDSVTFSAYRGSPSILCCKLVDVGN
ncbi:MAG: hypothetical protein EOM19_00240 [Candidatus Moranbacteria bacterium]|nr:hypothetical protein [Candidatus Moranbacteria bacterium]